MPFSEVKLKIWDLDNCLYPYDDAFHQACRVAAATAAISLGVELDQKAAELLAGMSYEKLGEDCEIFVRDYGVDRKSIHDAFHKNLSVSFIIKCSNTALGFENNLHCINSILSHGGTEWAKRVLAQRGYLEFFHQDMIVGLDSLNFKHRKNHGPEAFEYMLKLYQRVTGETITPQQVVMVEDTAENLIYPKRMGMQTVQITHGKDLPQLPHVDFMLPSPLDVLRM